MPKFDLTKIRPDIRALMRETMFRAVHHNAMNGLRRKTYSEFLRSLRPGAEPFSVERIWARLQETTRDHLLNHALPATEQIDRALGYSAPAEPADLPNGDRQQVDTDRFYNTITDDGAADE